MNENELNEISDKLNEYISTRNYRGFAGYVSTLPITNSALKQRIDNISDQLLEQADIDDKLLADADDNTRSAYNFITTGINKNEISTDPNNPLYNSYSSRFMRDWNNMVDDDGKINFSFAVSQEYDDFINTLGGTAAATKKGIELDTNYKVSIPGDINNKIEIYNALSSANMQTTSDDFWSFSLPFFSKIWNMNTDRSGENKILRPSVYDSEKPNNDITTLRKYNKIATSIKNMTNYVTEANNLYDKLFSNVSPYISEMMVTGYMGEDDKQLQQAFSNGLVDLQSFKEMRSILEEKYTRLLQTNDLSQYDIWAMNEDNRGSQVLQPLNNNLDKTKLNKEINQAIADKRLHFSHATNGLDIGTMLVIDPPIDSKTKQPKSNTKQIRLFVKDLFKSQAENALRDDTKISAMQQYAKHQTYGHAYRGSDGSTITNWNGATDTAVYTDRNGTSQLLDKAGILEKLDNDQIAKRLINYYNLANMTTKQGKGYTSEHFKVYGNSGFNVSTLCDNIEAKCLAAMVQQYQGQSEEYIKYMATELFGTILKGLGLNFDGDVDFYDKQGLVKQLLSNKGVNIK